MEKIFVSACLLGHRTKYNGRDNYLPSLAQLHERFEFIAICPEVDGGLSIPRYPAEIRGQEVINNHFHNVTEPFIKGAHIALELARKFNIRFAILKDNSPSCGSQKIYDGTFKGVLIPGLGVTAKILQANNIKVFNEHNFLEILGEK